MMNKRIEMFDKYSEALLIWASLIYIAFDLFGGIVRWVFAISSMPFLIYIPTYVAALSLSVVLLTGVSRSLAGQNRFSVYLVSLSIAFMFFFAVALGRPPAAALMALYICIPAFLIAILTLRDAHGKVFKALSVVFFVASVGVILNAIVAFPWSNSTYIVAGFEREASRQWSSGGVDRLAGFSRSSPVAAVQVLLGYCALQQKIRSVIWKTVWWTVGAIAIYYTNSKTILAAMLLLPLVLIAIGRNVISHGISRPWIGRCVLAGSVFTVFLGPFLAILYGSFVNLSPSNQRQVDNSFADRVYNTWPNAIKMVDWNNPINLLFGRGIGGIGVPQTIFEPPGNPGDNLAIYLLVTFGLCAFIFAWLIMRGGMRAIASGEDGRRDFSLILAMLGIASMANVVESIVPVMILSLSLSRQKLVPSRERV